jgi:hypothetical protein
MGKFNWDQYIKFFVAKRSVLIENGSHTDKLKIKNVKLRLVEHGFYLTTIYIS